MATNSGRFGDRSNEPIYFPLDQGERAAHINVNELLPRELYESLASLIKDSVPKTGQDLSTEKAFFETRGHTAIFIDGGRGTGKTTVAVNLREYLATPESRSRHGELANDVHVLKPIDPTQLEDSEDMFLNVIVAAVLSDEDIKKALERAPEKRQRLHEKLQRLGEALEGRESRSDGIGLDRLRSFMGSQGLAYAVHCFFLAALDLLGKRLLAMPIDDVDTTLHKAFDYLEVVRRYLSSVVVVPIVCGDLKLYREVTQRDAFRRLTKEMPNGDAPALTTSSDLAVEYLRKILPVQRRLQMPEISTILGDSRILLRRSDTDHGAIARVTMRQFSIWLYALLAGPVNGHENSNLDVPIYTVRALAQLTSSVRQEFPLLDNILYGDERDRPSTNLLRRLVRLHDGFPIKPRVVETDLPTGDPVVHLQPEGPLVAGWGSAMLDHFRFVPEAGQACLILLAQRHWREPQGLPVFDTPLFSPLLSSDSPELKYSNRTATITWRDDLRGRVAGKSLELLPTHLIIPFATPEIGRAVKLAPSETLEGLKTAEKRELALTLGLVVHRNFYSQGQQADLLYVGRILELVTTSLVRDVTPEDIERILRDPPFHSVAAIARTKAIAITSDEDEDTLEPATDSLHARVEREDITFLSRQINEWRSGRAVSQLSLSPWLIYCAVNKTLNQVAFFNRPKRVGGQPTRETWGLAAQVGLAAFNAFWAALGSFEKGPIFGLPLTLSNVNLTLDANFKQNALYLQNVRPFDTSATVVMSSDGDQVLSVTRILSNHPLELLLNFARDMFRNEVSGLEHPSDRNTRSDAMGTSREQLLDALGIRTSQASLRVASITKALLTNFPNARVARARAEKILRDFSGHSGIKPELRTLQRAIDELPKT